MQQNAICKVYYDVVSITRSGSGSTCNRFCNVSNKETKMSKYVENDSKSDLYARVKLAPVNAIQRAIAVNALRDAESVSNGIMRVIDAIRRLFARNNAGTNRLLHNH